MQENGKKNFSLRLPSNDIASSKSISIQDCHLKILPHQKHFSSRLPSNNIAASK